MAGIDVRSLMMTDVAALVALDHSYHTESVWQMTIEPGERETITRFRELRLPRSMRVEYPRPYENLADEWKSRPALLVAERESEVLGYINLTREAIPGNVLAVDLVVGRRYRRQGVGSALVRAAQTWAGEEGLTQLMLEMQSKNHPAICLAGKLGFEYCGYNDRYYPNRDIALFFARSVN